jgi:hypothetical protein
MANASVAVGTYAGVAARPYVSAAILAADTIANGYVSVLENVHSKAVLRKFSGAAIQANDDCAFTTPDSGQLTVGEAVLEAAALKVNEQVCNADLRATWESALIRSQNDGAPADFVTYTAQYVAAKVAESVEHNIWHGNFNHTTGAEAGATYTAFDGICRHLVDNYAAGNMQQLTGATVAETAATPDGTSILERLAALVAEAPAAIAGDPNTKLFMSRASAQLYYQALAATYNLPFLNDGLATRYAGYEIITPGGMADDAFLLSKGENLYFGTNLLTDHIQASILDLTGVTGDDVTRVIMQFSAGTQVVDAPSVSFAYRTS